ncbi:Nucleoprotein TPR/MLP1 domain-containing protein [Plasmodiophora brassicae]|uniref:Uncharacterized protein n=1 Tax=Plasmodiophora brassicae TaxID=37360 RepID=A0A3P3Y1W7_PLABS|nr:unnamed protein product [Plasmodiophora brassicae]
MSEQQPGSSALVVRAPPGSAAAFLDKKTQRELEDQIQQLKGECAQKDAIIADLTAISSTGRLQKQLQKALEDNRDLKKEISRLYEEQQSVAELQAKLEAQEATTQSVRDEFSEFREQTRIGIEQMKQDRERLDAELNDVDSRVQSFRQAEHDAVATVSQLEERVETLEEELASQTQLVLKLKDGTRLEELEATISTLTQSLSQKEWEREQLESELATSRDEYAQIVKKYEEFEHRIQSGLNEASTEVQVQLVKYKALASERESELVRERERYAQLESRVQRTDRELLDAYEQIHQYEEGYGIDEAMRDQRKLKAAMILREEENSQLSAKLSVREGQLQRLADENGILRLKAGVDPSWGVSEAELELEHNVEKEKLNSLVEYYKEHTERLERERVELLEELRLKAVQNGESGVVYFGLSADKMHLLDQYADRLREGDTSLPETDETSRIKGQLADMSLQLEEMRNKYAEVAVERNELRLSLQNVMQKQNDDRVDRILEGIRQLQAGQKADEILFIPNELDGEVTPQRTDSGTVPVSISADSPVNNHPGNVGAVKAPTRGPIRSELSAELLLCMEELVESQQLLQQSHATIAKYESSMAQLSSQVHALVYKQGEVTRRFNSEKAEMEARLEEMVVSVAQLTSERDSAVATVDRLKKDSDTTTLVDEYRRQIAVLQSNEILMTRKQNVLEHTLSALESREASARDDRISLERVLHARIVQLEDAVSALQQRLSTTEQQLRNSVSQHVYDALLRRHATTHARLSECLVFEAEEQVRSQEYSELRQKADSHAADAALALEKVASLEAALVILQGKLDSISSGNDDRVQLVAQVAALEVREGNAIRSVARLEQHAAEASGRYAQVCADLSALEKGHHDLLLRYHKARDEAEKQREAAAASDANHEKAIADLQCQLSAARRDAAQAKKLLQVAKTQALQLREGREQVEMEIEGLRLALIDAQTSSDDQAKIGSLHHELIATRLELRELQRRCESHPDAVNRLEAEILRQNQVRDELMASSFVENSALRARIRFFQVCLAEINTLNAGVLNADQAAALQNTNRYLSRRLESARTEVVQADHRRRQADLALAQMRVELDSANELASTFTQLRGTSKQSSPQATEERLQIQIIEWNKRLKHLKLVNMQLEHQCASLQHKIAFQEKSLSENASEIVRLQNLVAEKDSALETHQLYFKQQTSSMLELAQKRSGNPGGEAVTSSDQSALQAHFESEIGRLHAEVRSASSMIDSKNEVIELLRQQVARLESQIRIDADRENEAGNANFEQADAAKDRILKTADLTIRSLRNLLNQKNDALGKYRELLQRALSKYQTEKEVDQMALERLHTQLVEDKAEHSAALHAALQRISELDRIPSTLIPSARLDEVVAEKDARNQALSVELQSVQRLLQAANERIAQLQTHEQELEVHVRSLEADLKPSHETENCLASMREKLAEKDRKQKHLENAIMQLKEELVSIANRVTPKQSVESEATQKSIDALRTALKKAESQKVHVEQRNRQIIGERDSLRNELASLRTTTKERNEVTESERALRSQVESLSGKLESAQAMYLSTKKRLRTAQMELSSVQTECEALRKRTVEHETTIQTLNSSMEELRRGLQQSANPSQVTQSCSPIRMPSPSNAGVQVPDEIDGSASTGAFENWEQLKKLSKRIDNLKAKLKERSEELRESRQTACELERRLKAVEVEKLNLIAELQTAEAQHANEDNLIADSATMESIEELRAQLFEAHEQIHSLQQKLNVECTAVRKQLEFERDELRLQLKERLPRTRHDNSKLKQERDELAERNLTVCCENLDLRFDKEHSAIVIQRLRKRIKQLEHYKNFKGNERSHSGGQPAKDSKIEAELKSTVESMGQIIDRLKSDNETLRMNSHSHLKYSEAVRALKKAKQDWTTEVQSLKAELHAKSEQIGAMARADSSQKVAMRTIRKELTRVKKELVAKVAECELLSGSVTALEKQAELLRKSLEKAEAKDRAQSRPHSPMHSTGIQDLERQCADLMAENEALKTELSAFDMTFFDEIEDLKYQYSEVSKRLAQYRAQFGDLPAVKQI